MLTIRCSERRRAVAVGITRLVAVVAELGRSASTRNFVMKTIWKLFTVLAITLLILGSVESLFAQQNTKIKESQILGLLKSLDSAMLKKDAKSACTNFAEDAVITIVLFERGEKYTDTYDKKKYQANLEAGFPNFDDYTCERSGTRVHIAEDGKTATAKSTFVETFRRDGSRMKCTAEENYTFALADGKISIKTMSNIAKMQ